MTPKKFCRVLRFQRAINQIQQRRALPGPRSRLAAATTIRPTSSMTFREFCGLTPSDYLNERPEYPNFCRSLLGKFFQYTPAVLR